MSRWSASVCVIALVGCHDTPGARERALAYLPATARVIAVADGPALAAGSFRAAIDAARPIVPASLGCVIDAALAADAVAIAEDPGGVAIVVVGRVSSCPALARIAPDVWVAGIGTPPVAHDRHASVLGSVRWQRARSYLATSPVAAAADLGDRHVLAAAQPEPLELWVTIDAATPAALPDVHALVGDSRLEVSALDRQVTARARGLTDAELATLSAKLVHLLAAPPRGAAASFACPAAGDVVVHCQGTSVTVRSIAAALQAIAVHVGGPVISGAEIVGVRVASDVLGLRAGDLLYGIDGHRVTAAAQIEALVKTAPTDAALAVRRDATDLIVDLHQE